MFLRGARCYKKKIDDIYYVEEIHMMHFIEQFVEDMCK